MPQQPSVDLISVLTTGMHVQAEEAFLTLAVVAAQQMCHCQCSFLYSVGKPHPQRKSVQLSLVDQIITWSIGTYKP